MHLKIFNKQWKTNKNLFQDFPGKSGSKERMKLACAVIMKRVFMRNKLNILDCVSSG